MFAWHFCAWKSAAPLKLRPDKNRAQSLCHISALEKAQPHWSLGCFQWPWDRYVISALEKAQPHWSQINSYGKSSETAMYFCAWKSAAPLKPISSWHWQRIATSFLRLKKRSPIEAIFVKLLVNYCMQFLRLKKRSPIEANTNETGTFYRLDFCAWKSAAPLKLCLFSSFLLFYFLISALEKAQPHWSISELYEGSIGHVHFCAWKSAAPLKPRFNRTRNT